jgi:hypothetical protein
MNFRVAIQSRERKRRLGKKKQKHLPRNDTEKHGIRQKQKHGKEEEKTFLPRTNTEIRKEWIPAFARMTKARSDGWRLPLPVIPANAGIQRYKLPSMDLLSSQTKCNTIMIRCCHYGKTISTFHAGRPLYDCPTS